MRPSEARNGDEYLRILQAKEACETCKPLLAQMRELSRTDPFDSEAVLIRNMTTAHNCPGTSEAEIRNVPSPSV